MKSHRILPFAFLLVTMLATAALADEAGSSAMGVVNINTAEAGQLTLLPRIGEKTAAHIIEYRKANGPFKKTSDLMQVKGVGAKTYELIAPYVVVEGKSTLTTKVRSRKARATSSPTRPADAASN